MGITICHMFQAIQAWVSSATGVTKGLDNLIAKNNFHIRS